MKRINKMIRTTIFTALLILIAAFGISGTVLSQKDGMSKEMQEYYRTVEQEYVKELRTYLTQQGYSDSGVTMNRIINEDGTIQYVQLPLLVNVPVVFPGSSDFELKLILKQNDECLVLFSDLSIDNFWEKGSLQNPVEVRRHDLSDGIAIPCRLSLQKRSEEVKASIVVGNDGKIIFNSASGTFNSEQLYKIVYSHYHQIITPTGALNTTSPLGVDEQ